MHRSPKPAGADGVAEASRAFLAVTPTVVQVTETTDRVGEYTAMLLRMHLAELQQHQPFEPRTVQMDCSFSQGFKGIEKGTYSLGLRRMVYDLFHSPKAAPTLKGEGPGFRMQAQRLA